MSVVSKSFSVVYPVRLRVQTSGGGSFSLAFDSSFDSSEDSGLGIGIGYDVMIGVSKSVSVLYGVRSIMFPAKVFSLEYGVRKIVSIAVETLYGVRVPISSNKTFSLVHNVRSVVTKSTDLEYDVSASSSLMVSKSFSLAYHVLITPTVDEIITVPIAVDEVPPQIVTTSF